MEYKIIRHPTDELYHYGIMGMKWGVRKQREYSGGNRRRRKKEIGKSRVNKMLNTTNDSRMTDERRKELIKKILIGTALTTGAAVGVSALLKYGREYGDEIIKAGAQLQTVHMDPDIMSKGKFYTAKRSFDKIKYIGMFGKGADGSLKKKITADVGSNMKIAGNKNASKIYKELIDSNSEFREALGKASTFKDVEALKKDYASFNTYGLLGNGSYMSEVRKGANGEKAQKIFIEELAKRGYSGVADLNDRKNSGFNTKANIIFDTSKIQNIKVSDLKEEEVKKRTGQAAALLYADRKLSPTSLAITGTAAGGIGVHTVNKKYEKQNSKNKKK